MCISLESRVEFELVFSFRFLPFLKSNIKVKLNNVCRGARKKVHSPRKGEIALRKRKIFQYPFLCIAVKSNFFSYYVSSLCFNFLFPTRRLAFIVYFHFRAHMRAAAALRDFPNYVKIREYSLSTLIASPEDFSKVSNFIFSTCIFVHLGNLCSNSIA